RPLLVVGTAFMSAPPENPLTPAQVFATWWPLAASWLLMGTEMSLVSAVIARLDDASFHLAAFGGLVFPFALLIEAPIIMMLAASTALCVDRASFRTLLRFSTVLGAALTVVHALLAFTPLYDLVLVPLIGPPDGAVEPGRLGMQWMTPWTWAIADRRFHQGVLIRFGRSRSVVVGTVVRLACMGSLLGGGLMLGSLPGVVVACGALSTGVLAEMVTARIFARPVVSGPLLEAEPGAPLTLRRLLQFYIPLAITPILNLALLPIGSASIARMPMPLENLAVWSPVNGLVFLIRSVGIAFNEVVVSLSGRPGAPRVLRRFALVLALLATLVVLGVAFSPLSARWFAQLSGLSPEFVPIATMALPFAVLLPAFTVFVSLYNGFLLHAHQTRAIPESVGIGLLVSSLLLVWGVWAGTVPGAQMTLLAFSVGALAQVLWLRLRQPREMD
ncbi:MAG TPA: hypothetical protein DFR83_06770, partial [Deltaproteobacteria bacterium]|nr:hypothetical protein [Deltaproteobacteria bacterium]